MCVRCSGSWSHSFTIEQLLVDHQWIVVEYGALSTYLHDHQQCHSHWSLCLWPVCARSTLSNGIVSGTLRSLSLSDWVASGRERLVCLVCLAGGHSRCHCDDGCSVSLLQYDLSSRCFACLWRAMDRQYSLCLSLHCHAAHRRKWGSYADHRVLRDGISSRLFRSNMFTVSPNWSRRSNQSPPSSKRFKLFECLDLM